MDEYNDAPGTTVLEDAEDAEALDEALKTRPWRLRIGRRAGSWQKRLAMAGTALGSAFYMQSFITLSFSSGHRPPTATRWCATRRCWRWACLPAPTLVDVRIALSHLREVDIKHLIVRRLINERACLICKPGLNQHMAQQRLEDGMLGEL